MTQPQLPLTQLEFDFLQFQARCSECLRLLGINPTGHSISRFLIVTGRGQTQAALARRLHIPRTTLRRVIGDHLAIGAMEERGGLVFMAEEGRYLFVWIERETVRIAMGSQVGYSEELRAHFQKFVGSSRVSDSRAWQVSYDADIFLAFDM